MTIHARTYSHLAFFKGTEKWSGNLAECLEDAYNYIHIYFLKTTPVGSVVSGSAAFDAPFPVPMGYMIPVELTKLSRARDSNLFGHRRHFSGESDVLEFGVFPGTILRTYGSFPQWGVPPKSSKITQHIESCGLSEPHCCNLTHREMVSP